MKPPIEVESVRTALEAMRHATSLGLTHPLSHFLSIRAEKQTFITAAEADSAIFRSLSHLIRQRLNHQRAIASLPQITSYHDLPTLAEDYQQANTELEAWSLLYYRYVRVDLDLPMDDLEKMTGQPKRTLNRRQSKGIARLTQALIQREARTRNRYRQATLRAQLPLTYAPKLIGREALIATAWQTLTSPAYPRHLLLYGPPGIGKTWLALALAHLLIDERALDNVVWIEKPETNPEQLIRQIHTVLGIPFDGPYEPSLASHLQLTDTLVVLNHAQALFDYPDALDAALQLLGTVRLLLCAEHPSTHFINATHLRVPELDKEAALAYLAEEAGKINPLQAENIERFEALYRQLGGNPGALQSALAMGSRYRARLVSSDMYRSAWENAPDLSRVLWLVFALNYAKKRPEDNIMGFMRGFTTEEVRVSLADLTDYAVLETANGSEYTLSALARSFAVNILREDANFDVVYAAVERAADWLTEHPNTADSLHLLRTIQNGALPADLLIDLGYSVGSVLERAGEWLNWVHYLEPLYAAAVGEDRLWIGLRLGVARCWLAQWKASAYILSNVIEEAGRSGAFSLQAEAIIELAVVQRHQGLHEAVQKLLSQANRHYQHVNGTTGLERVSLERAWAALDRHEVSLAQGYLDRIVEAQQSGRAQSLAAHIALRSGNLDLALQHAELAAQAYQGDVPHFARVSALLGQIQYQIGNHNIAIDHLSGALDLMAQSHDLLGHARTRMNLAAIYLGIGNLRKALDYWRSLPDDLERLGDVESLTATLKNLELLNRVARHWKSRTA